MPRPDLPEPTDAQLRAAYERERQRTWPSYDLALADPLYGRLIRGAARRALINQARAAANPGPATRTAPRCPFCGCRSTGAAQPRPLDARQLAAGERPEP